MFVGDETITRWNMMGGVSYDSFDAVRKILLKHFHDKNLSAGDQQNPNSKISCYLKCIFDFLFISLK